MANVNPSHPLYAPISSALVNVAASAIEAMPDRLDALRLQINPERRLLRSFLHHVKKSADCTRLIEINKARGNEHAVLRKMADKKRHDEAAAKLAPMVEALLGRDDKPCSALPAPEVPVENS